jgi:hypothetical protein
MSRLIFEGTFLGEKDLNGLPKIALRKSVMKMLKSPLTPL